MFLPGATVVGSIFNNGVVLASEKRFSYGTFVVSRSGKKVFKISENVGAACAGMISDMQVLMREITAYVKIREMELRRPMPPNSVAKLMSVLLFERRFAPLLTQIIVGGVNKKPSIITLDPIGSVIPDDYACVGTGAEVAIGIVESEFSRDMNDKEAKDMAIKAIRSAVKRDAASGDGIDVLTISMDGCKEESFTF
jgi:proteasome beta subunit